jgi:zinc protease
MGGKRYDLHNSLFPATPYAAAENLPTADQGTASLPGPDNITRVRLPNDIVVLSRANFNSPSVVVSGFIQCGALFEPDDKLGLADFTAASLMRGTQKRSFQEIYDLLESAGANLSFEGSTHTTGFGGKALAEDLDLLLGLLADAFRRPSFPESQVERLRAQILTRLAIRAQDTGEVASLAFDEIVYANHPYSRPEDGYPDTIQRITLADLEAFHRKHYGPAGMVIAVVGAVDPQQAVERVAAVLGDWSNPDQPAQQQLPEVTRLDEMKVRRVTIPGKYQSDLMMGVAGPPRRSPDYLPAVLGNSVLGQFGMMGRIGDVVREKAGLAYSAHSSLNSGLGPGPWTVSAGVDPANVDRAMDLIRSELRRFTTEPVLSEELADSQANFIGRLPLTLETNGGVAGALLNLERYELGLDYYHRYPDLIRAVTVEAVLATASRYLHPDRLGVGIAGP